MNYSRYQQAIFSFIRGESSFIPDDPIDWDRPIPEPVDFLDKRNAVVEAVAGSGKTSTIVKSLDYVPKIMDDFGILRSPKVLFVAFNSHIAKELASRVPAYVKASTLNSVGWGVCRDATKCELDADKTSNILRTFLNCDDDEERKVFYRIKGSVTKIVGLTKALMLFDEDTINSQFAEIADKYDIEIPEDINFQELTVNVWRKAMSVTAYMDFDDQIAMPIYKDWTFPSYDWVFGDEAQDWSPVQIELVKRLGRNGRIIAVGDRHQCQPTGTLVTVVGSDGTNIQKPIEQIRRNDTVVSYDAIYREWRQSDYVLATQSRDYNGDIITITTSEGHTSSYTPQHKCYTSFESFKDRWCVYLMKRGDHYRVGKSAMNYGENGSGPGHRLRMEGADALWILSLHDASEECFIEEQIISWKFNIPQMTFQLTSTSKISQDELDYFWNVVGDNTSNAITCLESFGRRLEYPLLDSSDRESGYRLKRPMITQACNLLDGCLVLPYEEGKHLKSKTGAIAKREDWLLASVKIEHYEGQVHSLSISKNRNYIGNGILTSNSIYGFRGSDPDAIPNIIAALDAVVLPLSICYRCPDKVIAEARKIVPHIENPPQNPKGDGKVEWINTDEFVKRVDDGDYVLCRTTAPLVMRCMQQIRAGKKATVKGKDIGRGLCNLLDSLANDPKLSVEVFLERLAHYKATQIAKLTKAGREQEASNVEDRCDTLEALAMDCNTVGDITRRIDQIFSDTARSGIIFMSGHRSKGLEAARIYFLRPDLCPHPKSTKDWQVTQEKNLKYVIITRAMSDLYFVRKEKDER